jgi:hypothetical protein
VDQHGGPTWVALIVAMEKIKETGAAGHIEEQVSPSLAAKIFQSHFEELYKFITRHQAVYEVICEEIKCRSNKLKPLLVCDIQNMVYESHDNLKKIGQAIEKYITLDNSILRDYNAAFTDNRADNTVAESTNSHSSTETMTSSSKLHFILNVI